MFTDPHNSYPILQIGLVASSIALLLICLTTSLLSKIYIGLTYALSSWCFIAFVVVRYLPYYTADAMGIMVLLLAATSTSKALANYTSPETDRAYVNQKLVYGFTSAILLVLSLWFFDMQSTNLLSKSIKKVETKADSLQKGQKEIKAKIATVDKAVRGQTMKYDSNANVQRKAEKTLTDAINNSRIKK